MGALFGPYSEAESLDAKRRLRTAMRADMESARERFNLSPQHLASMLDLSDTDSAARALGMLYKTIEGYRKYPHWKIGEWARLTGGDAFIRELCDQSGGLFVPLPDDREIEPADLAQCVSAFGEFVSFTGTVGALSGDMLDETECELLRGLAAEAVVGILGLVAHVTETDGNKLADSILRAAQIKA